MKSSSLLYVAVAVVIIAAGIKYGSDVGMFSLFPPLRELSVGSCVDYSGDIWRIAGPEDTSRITIPLERIKDGYRIDANAGSANDFRPIECTSVCVPALNCGEWNDCFNGFQTRGCNNGCGVDSTESRSCQVVNNPGTGTGTQPSIPTDNSAVLLVVVVVLLIGAVYITKKKGG